MCTDVISGIHITAHHNYEVGACVCSGDSSEELTKINNNKAVRYQFADDMGSRSVQNNDNTSTVQLELWRVHQVFNIKFYTKDSKREIDPNQYIWLRET